MSEEARGRHVVHRAERRYGKVLLGPLYADVEMAHGAHGTRVRRPVCRFLQVYKYTSPRQAASALSSASASCGWANGKPSASGRSGTARWPLTTMSAISP